MVNFMLLVAADLEKIAKLEPNEGVDDPNFCYYLSLKCSQCSSIQPKEVCLTLSEHQKFKKAEIHLKKECKLCGQEGIITMIPGEGFPVTNSQKKDYAPLMVFDCDGYEPVDFVFSRGWRAVSVAGIDYRDIDFTNGDFVIQEEDTVVGVSGLRCFFKQVNLHSPKKKRDKGVTADSRKIRKGKRGN